MKVALIIAMAAWVSFAGALGCGADDAKKPPPYQPPPRTAPPPEPEPPPPSFDASEPEVELSPRECVAACQRRNMARAVGADEIESDCYAECEAKCQAKCLERAERRGDPSENIEKDCADGCKIRRGI